MDVRLRAAVYQRVLTDNIVGLDLEENPTTKWHDEAIGRGKLDEGSGVVSHGHPVVESTLSLFTRDIDQKILSIANVFRLLHQKRRYEIEDLPLWWTWKHGYDDDKVEMTIALERMRRWIYSTGPFEVISLMRHAMVAYYVLADEGLGNATAEILWNSDDIIRYNDILRSNAILKERDKRWVGSRRYRIFKNH